MPEHQTFRKGLNTRWPPIQSAVFKMPSFMSAKQRFYLQYFIHKQDWVLKRCQQSSKYG